MYSGTPPSPSRALKVVLSLHFSPFPFPLFSFFYPFLDLLRHRALYEGTPWCLCSGAPVHVRMPLVASVFWVGGQNAHTLALFSPLSPFPPLDTFLAAVLPSQPFVAAPSSSSSSSHPSTLSLSRFLSCCGMFTIVCM